MKVNIDLRYSYNIGGISNFIRNLASTLSVNGKNEYCGSTFWYHGRNKSQYEWFKGEIHNSLLPDRLVCNSKIILPFTYETATNNQFDLNLFFTYRLPKLLFKKPVISTIHDIILLKSDCEAISIVREHEKILRRSINASDHILTVSEASKKDLIEYFGIFPDKISIIRNGIDFDYLAKPISTSEMKTIKAKYSLPDKFILNFGAYRVHKNIERLLEAYALFPETIRKEYKLVLTRSNEMLNKLICNLKIENDVIITGFVNEEDKKALYQMADVVYYASLYEGFGVPIIEAQACQTPVLTSNISSMPEASGGAAFLINPYSVDEIRDGLLTLISDFKLGKEITLKGLLNAQKYSWQESAKEVERVLNKLAL